MAQDRGPNARLGVPVLLNEEEKREIKARLDEENAKTDRPPIGLGTQLRILGLRWARKEKTAAFERGKGSANVPRQERFRVPVLLSTEERREIEARLAEENAKTDNPPIGLGTKLRMLGLRWARKGKTAVSDERRRCLDCKGAGHVLGKECKACGGYGSFKVYE